MKKLEAIWLGVKTLFGAGGALAVGEVAVNGPEDSMVVGLWQNVRDTLKITETTSDTTAMFAKLYQFIIEACDMLGAGEDNWFRNYAEGKLGLDEGSSFRADELAGAGGADTVEGGAGNDRLEAESAQYEVTPENQITLANLSAEWEEGYDGFGDFAGDALQKGSLLLQGAANEVLDVGSSLGGHIADLNDEVYGRIGGFFGIDTGYQSRDLSVEWNQVAMDVAFKPEITSPSDAFFFAAGSWAPYFIPGTMLASTAVGLGEEGLTLANDYIPTV